ncbi:phosphotransferase [Methylomonas sp. UP202]|uniref:aminoglycoside phosphotransferase family protein n=1 Tax=Methylomonas sp. UP202 TaxID=3040943 RepID=UPI00247A8830|nr:phosphotransferase [Methylomonas sp. UP202]WGS84916.1 phosphotransferase [Methylomonas sp. UP202]
MYFSSSDSRLAELNAWLVNDLALDVRGIAPASSDASFRRYFRVSHGLGSQIAMDAPPDKENTEPFVKVAELFAGANIHVPKIYRQNRQRGFLLLEDFGSTSYLDALTPDNADTLYGDAIDGLLTLQTRLHGTNLDLPAYDATLLRRELGIFHEWFLAGLLNLTMTSDLADATHSLLIDSALEQPRVCVHRDYHSRNLMLLAQASPGVIDFQDAVIGPLTYDLVSLLRDCYIAWPEQRVDTWVDRYYQQALTLNLTDADFGQFRRWFDLMGMQRHLKAIGIFARLHLRDGKSGYLQDIPRTLNYVEEVCRRYPELEKMGHFLQQHVLPRYAKTL